MILFALGCGGSPATVPDAAPAIDAAPDAPPLPACGSSPLPAACGPAAASEPTAGSLGSDGPFTPAVESFANPHASAPGAVRVYLPTGVARAPVVFFAHAFGAIDPVAYDRLLRHLATTGLAVVYVPYPLQYDKDSPITDRNADRYACLWDGFVAAASRYASRFDLTRVGFVGHSFGGGAAVELARRGFGERGWGSAAAFLYILAPWYSWGAGYDTLPAHVRTVIEVFADDEANDHQIAVREIWNRLPAAMEKAWLLVRSDVCGACGLNAPHNLPMTDPSANDNPQAVFNAIDRWGVWRRLDALAAYAQTGAAAARAVAFGADTDMGTWAACGRAVRPIEASTTAPITASCVTPAFAESARCRYADPSVPCP